jgi:hypothetical protein
MDRAAVGGGDLGPSDRYLLSALDADRRVQQPCVGLETVWDNRTDIHREGVDAVDDPSRGRGVILQVEQSDAHLRDAIRLPGWPRFCHTCRVRWVDG